MEIELFDNLESPIYSEWKNMPEFLQDKQEPFAKIIVRFDSQESLDEFASLIGQKLTNKTKSIWHPQLIRGLNADKRYVDES
jgi:hypothetical protein